MTEPTKRVTHTDEGVQVTYGGDAVRWTRRYLDENYGPTPIYEAAWEAVYGADEFPKYAPRSPAIWRETKRILAEGNYGAYVEVGKPEGYVDSVIAAMDAVEAEMASDVERDTAAGLSTDDAPSPSRRLALLAGGLLLLAVVVLLVLTGFGWN